MTLNGILSDLNIGVGLGMGESHNAVLVICVAQTGAFYDKREMA